MPPFLLYLLKLSISLSIVWIFYQLFLRRLTFYRMNRWYLLGYSLLSIFIPLINIGPIFRDGYSGEPVIIQYIPAIGNVQSLPLSAEVHSGGIAGWNMPVLILVLGALLLLVRSVLRWVSLLRLRQQARPIDGEGIKIYQIDASIIPFSFGNAIYINQHLHTEKEWSDIILHEYVHIRQKHTVDILLAEVLCVLNWYNPFCWLIRHSIRQNLEFIADSQVLKNGVDKKGYQYHLLKVIGESRYRLVSNFNFSSLKKRIIMMNKIRSARFHLVKFLFIVPLIAVLLLAFRDKPGLAGNTLLIAGPGTPLLLTGDTGLPVVTAVPVAAARAAAPATVTPAVTAPVVAAVPAMAAPAVTAVPAAMAAPAVTPPPPPAPAVSAPVPSASLPSVTAVPVGSRRDTAVPGNAARPVSVIVMNRDSVFAKALYVVDGIPRPDFQKDSLRPNDISSMYVLKGDEALRYYGEKGAHGAIVIVTKAFREKHPPMPTVVVTRKDSFPPGGLSTGNPPAEPLYVVDGQIVTKEGMKKISPDDIESINVLKGKKVRAKYGDKGNNGVVEITLKKKTSSIQPVMSTETKDGLVSVQANTIKTPSLKLTVYDMITGN
jgi:hypothetical protein